MTLQTIQTAQLGAAALCTIVGGLVHIFWPENVKVTNLGVVAFGCGLLALLVAPFK